MSPHQHTIKIAWWVTAGLILGALTLPFFFRSTSPMFPPLTLDDVESYQITKLADLALHPDRPTVYAAAAIGEMQGEKEAFIFLRTLPTRVLFPSLIRREDAVDSVKSLVGQQIIVMKGLQSSHISENNGWILNPFVEPVGEAVTSKELGLDTTLAYRFSVDREGAYALYARLRHDDSRGTLFVRIDDDAWSDGYQPSPKNDPDGDLIETVFLGTWSLNSREHTITFLNAEPTFGKGYQSLYEFALVEDVSQESLHAPSISFTPINRFRYDVKVSAASAPYILGLDQPFDSSWRLQQNGKSRPPEALVEGRGMAWRMEAGESVEFTLVKRPVVPWWGGLALALVLYALARTLIYFLWEKE